MNDGFYSALCSAATAVIAIVCAFSFASIIYLKQRQDDLSIEIKKNLQSLNGTIGEFSQIEEYPRPEWARPTSNYIIIMEKESWDKSPEGIFKKEVDQIRSEFYKEFTKHKGNFPLSAVLNKVKFELHGLFHKMYLEFPAPPGRIRKEGKLMYFESFIRDDFPLVQKDFELWAQRYNMFYGEIIGLYINELRYIISEIKKTAKRELKRSKSNLEELKSIYPSNDFMIEGIADYELYLASESQYYDKYISYLVKIRDQVSIIQQEMIYYKNYEERNPSIWSWIFLSFSTMFGVIIPILMLSGIKKPAFILTYNIYAELIVFLGFVIFLIFSVYALVRNG